jgi:DnaJ family protein B protein 13
MFGYSFGGQNYKYRDAIPTLEVDVPCTLNELYNGCTKSVRFRRVVLNPDGRTTQEVPQQKEIEIKRGSNSTTSIIFQGQGNEAPGLPTCKPFSLVSMNVCFA